MAEQKIERFIRQWDRIHHQTIKVIKTAPGEKFDWRPVESVMTLGELLGHLVDGEHFLVTAALTGAGERSPHDLKSCHTADQIVEIFDAQHRGLVEQVSQLDDDQLHEEIELFGRRLKRTTLLWGATEHEIHHRGQLFVYLRILGLEPPSPYS
jgi:uncharacterized damage-inducible protein DinB